MFFRLKALGNQSVSQSVIDHRVYYVNSQMPGYPVIKLPVLKSGTGS